MHLQGIGKGQTYSQVSAQSQANPNDAALAAETQTLFRGETLRGLLLYAWGWSVVGEIAFLVGIAAAIGAVIVLFALALGYLAHVRQTKQLATAPSGPAVDVTDADHPVPVG